MKIVVIEDLVANELVSSMIVPNVDVFKRELKRSILSSGKVPVWLEEGFCIKVYSSDDDGHTYECEYGSPCEDLLREFRIEDEDKENEK